MSCLGDFLSVAVSSVVGKLLLELLQLLPVRFYLGEELPGRKPISGATGHKSILAHRIFKHKQIQAQTKKRAFGSSAAKSGEEYCCTFACRQVVCVRVHKSVLEASVYVCECGFVCACVFVYHARVYVPRRPHQASSCLHSRSAFAALSLPCSQKWPAGKRSQVRGGNGGKHVRSVIESANISFDKWSRIHVPSLFQLCQDCCSLSLHTPCHCLWQTALLSLWWSAGVFVDD